MVKLRSNTLDKFNPRPYCDVELLPKDDRLRIVLRVASEPLDTILDASLQDGFPGWEADFFLLEDWAWNFIDVRELKEYMLEYSLETLRNLEGVSTRRYTKEWSMKIGLKRMLNGTYKKKPSERRHKSQEQKRRGFVPNTKEWTEYQRRRFKHIMSGRKLSDAHVEAIRKARLGKTWSPEVRKKISERANTARGEAHGHAKLTEAQVLEIVETYNKGTHSQRQLARTYNISRPAIASILKGWTWHHITGIVPQTPRRRGGTKT